MGDWSYVVLAYGVVGGVVAGYTLILRRRIMRSHAGVEDVQQTVDAGGSTGKPEDPVCDAPSVP